MITTARACPYCNARLYLELSAGSAPNGWQFNCPECGRTAFFADDLWNVAPADADLPEIIVLPDDEPDPPPVRRPRDGRQDNLPVDRCYLCGRPVRFGEFRREQVVVSEYGGLPMTAAPVSAAAWAGWMSAGGSLGDGYTIKQYALQTVCIPCSEEREARERWENEIVRPDPDTRAGLWAALIVILTVVFVFVVLAALS